MDRFHDYNTTPVTSPTPKDEPKVENDYTNRPEIEQPDPSTATPPIPQEMPPI